MEKDFECPDWVVRVMLKGGGRRGGEEEEGGGRKTKRKERCSSFEKAPISCLNPFFIGTRGRG